MPIKHGKVVTYNEGTPPINSRNSLKRWWCDNLKMFLHYQKSYGHQTCQGDDILQGAPTSIFEKNLNNVVMWGNMTK